VVFDFFSFDRLKGAWTDMQSDRDPRDSQVFKFVQKGFVKVKASCGGRYGSRFVGIHGLISVFVEFFDVIREWRSALGVSANVGGKGNFPDTFEISVFR